MRAMLEKYRSKKLVFILDNLTYFSFTLVKIFRAHKSSLIFDLVKEKDRVNLLCTPSNTPEFSPIENLFGHIKRTLSDFEFKKEVRGK